MIFNQGELCCALCALFRQALWHKYPHFKGQENQIAAEQTQECANPLFTLSKGI
jgi:hypothetical protein